MNPGVAGFFPAFVKMNTIVLAEVLMDLNWKLDVWWKTRGRHALDWYPARLMPTVENTEGPLGYDCFSISRGIKNMQRKSQWKDKCVATLWGTQKWNLSRGTYTRYFLCFTLKSPESLVYFYPVLVQSQHRGTRASLWYQSEVRFFELPFCGRDLWTGVQDRANRLAFHKYCMKTIYIHTLSPFLTL